jgi:peptide/nickel transport system permease protein
MVGGSVIVERIFGIPGMGLLAWEGVMGNDVPVVMAVVVLSAIATMVGYLVADLLYAWVDPRVRHR